jgi:hypothetical protein
MVSNERTFTLTTGRTGSVFGEVLFFAPNLLENRPKPEAGMYMVVYEDG